MMALTKVQKEKIRYSTKYGVVYEDIVDICEEVTNDSTKETYLMEAPSIGIFDIISQHSPKVGDEITTTSAEFEIDALTGHYLSNCNLHNVYKAKVIATFVEFQGENYIPGKSCNGGAYLHTLYKIQEILNVEYQE